MLQGGFKEPGAVSSQARTTAGVESQHCGGETLRLVPVPRNDSEASDHGPRTSRPPLTRNSPTMLLPVSLPSLRFKTCTLYTYNAKAFFGPVAVWDLKRHRTPRSLLRANHRRSILS